LVPELVDGEEKVNIMRRLFASEECGERGIRFVPFGKLRDQKELNSFTFFGKLRCQKELNSFIFFGKLRDQKKK
jgi:hypothetical protein